MTTTNFTNSQMPNASTTEKGAIIIATNADVSTGTNETKAVNPKDLKTNYGGCYIATGTSAGTNGTTINFTHGLGRTPKMVRLEVLGDGDVGQANNPRPFSNGYYDGNNYVCLAVANFNISSSIRGRQFSLTGRIGWAENENTSPDGNRGTKITVTTLTNTSITLTNTVSAGSAVPYTYMLYAE